MTPQTSPTSPSSTPPRRPSQQMRQSMLKTLPSDPSMITPAISAALPAFQLVEDRERTPEPSVAKSDVTESSVPETYLNLDDSDDEDGGATQYILAPRTYTPIPSPKQPSAPFQEPTPPPEENRKLSLRKRLSISLSPSSPEVVEPQNDDDAYWGPRKPVFSVSEAERLRANSDGSNNERGIAPITVPTPQELEAITSSPPQGIDSAYFSDEKTFSPPLGIHPALFSSSTPNSPYVHPSARLVTPPMLRDGTNSTRNEHQRHFLPVNASPHSPLQRPWTAAPASHHAHHNSNFSNLSNGSNISTMRSQLPPSSKPRTLRNMPSATGMSTMTYMTEGGTKKKKKSAFGWLKKAFSLSEEEKAAFEEKRRRANDEARYYEERPAPKWIDGKRIR